MSANVNTRLLILQRLEVASDAVAVSMLVSTLSGYIAALRDYDLITAAQADTLGDIIAQAANRRLHELVGRANCGRAAVLA